MAEFVEVQSGGRLRVNFHEGQRRAWESDRRIVCMLAGTQGGKTVFGPHWLYREIQRQGPGDYLVVTPTFPLLELKALPAFRELFEGWLRVGRYYGSPVRVFRFSASGMVRTFGHGQWSPTSVFFGYAADPESLESATAKAAWLDEAGQRKFRLSSWEAIQRRLAINEGRVLITTTPYGYGWIEREIVERWERGDGEIDVVRFESIVNPRFSAAEFERARERMPEWKFDLFYRARLARPPGLIYDSFNAGRDVVDDVVIPAEWRRWMGIDYGGVNMAAVYLAENPDDGTFYLYREYLAGGRTIAEHVRAMLDGEGLDLVAVGGSWGEDQWRMEMAAAGLYVWRPGVREVEVGIDRVYAFHRAGRLKVLRSCIGYLDQKARYRRETDESGRVLVAIADKSSFHYMDAERYVVSFIGGGGSGESSVVMAVDPLVRADERSVVWRDDRDDW